MNVLRHYEILLPLRFNDGRPVPESLRGEVVLELRQQFRALTCETQVLQGFWESEGVFYEDQLVRIYLDLPDTADNREFFKRYKERLKERFQQLDIWITSHLVDAL